MFLRILFAAVLGVVPGTVTAETFPESYAECRTADDPAAGIAACQDALKSSRLLQTERARAYLMLARYQQQTGALQSALDSLDEAGAIAPNAPDIPAQRAIVLHSLGDLSGASAAHARAFELGPETATLLNNRGITRLALGDTAAAIADFDAALSHFENGTILENRSLARCRAGDVDASVADRLAAMKLNGIGGEEIEAVIRASGFEGGLTPSATEADAASALTRWTAAGCPGAPAAQFF
jgi:tetratricopeptide (TPR) repeat protein